MPKIQIGIVVDIYNDGTYLDLNPTWHEQDGTWKAGHIVRMLRRHGLAPIRICDVGCGNGLILNTVQQAFPEALAHGYDISADALRLSAEHASSRIRFFLRDLKDIHERYDLALAIDVIEHVEDYRGFLRDMRRLADTFIFHIPLEIHVQGVIRGTRMQFSHDTVGHIHYFSKETALQALRDTGYEVSDYFYTHLALRPPHTPRRLIAGFCRLMAARIHEDLSVRFLGGSELMVVCH